MIIIMLCSEPWISNATTMNHDLVLLCNELWTCVTYYDLSKLYKKSWFIYLLSTHWRQFIVVSLLDSLSHLNRHTAILNICKMLDNN